MEWVGLQRLGLHHKRQGECSILREEVRSFLHSSTILCYWQTESFMERRSYMYNFMPKFIIKKSEPLLDLIAL